MSRKSTPRKEDDSSALVPKLRFPEFQNGGEWKEDTLENIATFRRGSFPQPYGLPEWYDDDKGMPFIQVYDVGDDLRLKDKTKNRISTLGAEKSVYIPEGTLIVTLQGSIGRVAITQYEAYIDRTLLIFESFQLPMDKGFFARAIQNLFDLEKEKAPGGIIKTITKKALSAFKVRCPGVDEQQKIAGCLSSVDEMIAAQARKVEALEAHKKGLMQQLFPREGETQPRLRFPEFENDGEWLSDSLGNIFETTSGGTPSRREAAYWNGDIPWISTALVDFRVITCAEEFITEKGLKNSSAKIFPKGTVLMAMYGQGKTRGQVALLGFEAATNQACAAILPREGIDPYFVFANLTGRYEEIREISNRGGQENLSQGLVRELRFSFPSNYAEQRKVTSCLSSLDTLITAEKEKLEILRRHKRGLMQQLFPSPEELEA